jgi:hypothetical protein
MALDDVLTAAGIHRSTEVPLPGSADVAIVVQTTAGAASAVWEALRAATDETGRYPVVVGLTNAEEKGSQSELEITLENALFQVDDGDSVAEALADAGDFDFDEWVQEHGGLDADPVALPLEDLGEPDAALSIAEGLGIDEDAVVELALLPTTTPWEAPAHLLWGSWNEVPGASELAGMLRRWNEGFGAEVMAMTADVLLIKVARPPADDDTAVELAREHYLVAPDVIDQGDLDVEALATMLRRSPGWFLWWD